MTQNSSTISKSYGAVRRLLSTAPRYSGLPGSLRAQRGGSLRSIPRVPRSLIGKCWHWTSGRLRSNDRSNMAGDLPCYTSVPRVADFGCAWSFEEVGPQRAVLTQGRTCCELAAPCG